MKTNISITIDGDEIDKIKITCQTFNISLSNLIENLIISYNKNTMSKDVAVFSKNEIKQLFSKVQTLEMNFRSGKDFETDDLKDFHLIKTSLLSSL
jgi:hypothetical protein